MNFGENLRRIRLEKGMTQVELANAVEVKQPIIAMYERGSKQPTIATAQAIARALGCELMELVGCNTSSGQAAGARTGVGVQH